MTKTLNFPRAMNESIKSNQCSYFESFYFFQRGKQNGTFKIHTVDIKLIFAEIFRHL